jgi:hypothetical protein
LSASFRGEWALGAADRRQEKFHHAPRARDAPSFPDWDRGIGRPWTEQLRSASLPAAPSRRCCVPQIVDAIMVDQDWARCICYQSHRGCYSRRASSPCSRASEQFSPRRHGWPTYVFFRTSDFCITARHATSRRPGQTSMTCCMPAAVRRIFFAHAIRRVRVCPEHFGRHS